MRKHGNGTRKGPQWKDERIDKMERVRVKVTEKSMTNYNERMYRKTMAGLVVHSDKEP